MAVFLLQNIDYDYQQDNYFSGPDVPEAESDELCDRLLKEAAEDLIAGRPLRMDATGLNRPDVFGLPDLSEEIALRLPDHGFTPTRLTTALYVGGYYPIVSHELEREEEDGPPPSGKGLGAALGPDLTKRLIARNAEALRKLDEEEAG